MADLIPASPMPTVLLSVDRKSGSAGMPRPSSYAVFCLKKKTFTNLAAAAGAVNGSSIRIGAQTIAWAREVAFTVEVSVPLFFNNTATNEIYTLSLHDALPIFSHSTRNKTRDGLIRVRNIRALNGRFNTSITHAYSIVIGSKHITLNATGGGFLTASKQFRHGATSKSRSNTASNSTKHK